MSATNYYNVGNLSKVIYTFCILFIILFVSCTKEDDQRGAFELKDNPETLTIPEQGSSETFTFQANGNWKIEPLRKERWLKIDPAEGNGDGTFTVNVSKNTTSEVRTTTLFFVVEGQLQNDVLKIQQAAATGGETEEGQTFIYIEGAETGLQIPETGLTERRVIRATGAWRAELSDEDADWIQIEPMQGTGDTPIQLSADINPGDVRTVNLNFYLDDVLQTESLLITQENVIVILEEYFDWLSYGSPIFYTTGGETRIDNWTIEQKARGWTTSPSADGITSTYARQGFVKLGKTNYGSDFISPKLNEVEGTKNLEVRFKAVPYMTAGGTKDDTRLYVSVIGPGAVSVDEFNINNWPDYSADPNCTEIWKAKETERSFVITGATAETQIRFLGGALDLREATGAPINKNRIFLDDIIVTVKKR